MIYRKFQDLELSMLGFGAMRLPTIDGVGANIDEALAQEMVDTAIAGGINYFDTAWGYHDGNSETFIGKALSRHPRESFYLASKLPGYDVNNFGKHEAIFEEQLKKCRVDYFDFYLFHNVCELNVNHFLANDTYHTYDYLLEQKKNGRIRHLGFSTHGTYDTMKRFLEAYGDALEFCQIQLNYLDWDFQDAKRKLELLREYQLPVWVMEPLRGGKLAKLPETHSNRLKKLRPDLSDPAWSFRFLQSVPEVAVILSGMSDMQQLNDNIDTFETDEHLNNDEMAVLFDIAKEMTQKTSVPCTGCRYCTTHCPQGLNIPYLLELYNEHTFTQKFAFIAPMALQALDADKLPSACVGCKSCEAVCPQNIKIADILKDFSEQI